MTAAFGTEREAADLPDGIRHGLAATVLTGDPP